ncbi:MAG: hypothetical protein ACK59R_13265 [Pseudomonadota bacterium]
MANERLIAFAGVGDAESAHLRALVARAAELLETSWRVAIDDEADLVVADPATRDGERAQARAAERGVPCVLIDAEGELDLLLARPFEIDGLMQLLVGAESRLPRRGPRAPRVVGGAAQLGLGRADIVPPALSAEFSLADFLADDLLARIPDARTAGERERPPAPGLAPPVVDPAAEPPSDPAAADVEAAVVEAPFGQCVTAESVEAEPEATAARACYPLLDYLVGGLIGLPSRIVLPGRPPLVIDPETRMFHFAGVLSEVEPYLDTPLPRTQWSALLEDPLATLRLERTGRPFDLLCWYQALRTMPAGLPAGLEPAELYSVEPGLDLAADHPRAARIAAVMQAPRRLGEIASMASTSVAELYAVLGAFRAVGWLRHHPRLQTAVAEAARRSASTGPSSRL